MKKVQGVFVKIYPVQTRILLWTARVTRMYSVEANMRDLTAKNGKKLCLQLRVILNWQSIRKTMFTLFRVPGTMVVISVLKK